MSTDFPKPPLAPKPSLDQAVPLTTCNQFSLGHRHSLHLHSNSMSSRPKPPLAPKPLLLTSEGRSSVYINNTLNSCANGELICYEAHLTAHECVNIEHQCKCLEPSNDNSVLDPPEVDDTQGENVGDSGEVLENPMIMKGQDHDSSVIFEFIDPKSDESMGTEGHFNLENMCEVFSSKVDAEDAPSSNEEESTDFEKNELEAGDDLAVRVMQSPCDHNENVSDQNPDEDFDGEEHMMLTLQHIGLNKYILDQDYEDSEVESDCLQHPAEESTSEEREHGECSTEADDIVTSISLDKETSLTHHESNEEEEAPHSFLEDNVQHENTSINDAQDNADLGSLETSSSSIDCLNEEETDGGLEMVDEILADDFSDECQKETENNDEEFPPEKENVEASNCEIDRNLEQGDNVDDGYETIEIKSEEESSEAANDEGEVSKEDSAEKDDTLDESCQIIPFESDCNEDLLDIPHGYLDEFWHIERGYGHQEACVPTNGVDPNCIRNHNGVSECILEEESEDGEEGGQQFTDGMSSLKERELGEQPTEEGDENSDDDATVHEKQLTNELGQSELRAKCKCIDYSTDCLSLTDDEEENPYVLENSLHSRGENCFCGERIVMSRSADSTLGEKILRDDPSLDIDNNLLSIDRKNIVTRSRSLSGKITGCVPETVPEETTPESESQYTTCEPFEEVANYHLQHLEGKHTEINRLLPVKPRRFIQYPRSYSVEGRESPLSMYRESNGTSFENSIIRGKDDNISLPCVLASSGSFSHRSQIYSSGVSSSSSGVDIPPPFELASITKKPITKSSPSLLIENDSPDKYFKKKKSSFKRFLTLKFRKKTENKIHVDVNVSSSRSSSESSYHGPSRLVEMDRRSLGGSPQLKPHSGKMRACDSPSAVVLYKDGKRKGTPKSFSRSVARVESFEDRTRPPFMPLPLTKPRSISFPNADTSDYENIPAMSSDYENVQIPPRRPTRAGTFTEFFEDPSRALASANENDGYVDMSSFTTFEMKQQAPDREAESAYTEPYKSCPVSPSAAEDTVSDDEAKTSEDETSVPGHTNLGPKKEGQSRAHIIAEELLSSEKVYVERLEQLHTDFYTALLKVLGDEDEDVKEEAKLRKGLSTLPQICELHRGILSELEERLKNWEETQKLANVILERASGFQQHAAYIIEFDRNLALLDESCLRSHQVASVIREYENPNWGRVSVKHQLLRVTERIFQYHMILTDYLNNLCPDYAEYEDTQAALVLVSEVADQANERMRQGENLQKLVHIEHSVRGQSNLLESGREFVKEGTLMKVSGKDRHPRHLFLMNDVLLYTYPQKDGKYRLKNTLSIAGMRVSRPILENTQNVLRVECMDCCLMLSASSCSERDEWYCCISRTIQDYYKAHSPASYHNNVEVRERLGLCLGEKPPSLVPMSHVMMCMSCSSDFTLTLRRNHCHACGKIVCRNCSKKKYPLRYLKDRPAKVCDACYAELKKREMPVMIVSIPQPSSSRFASSAFSSVLHSIHPSSFKKQRKIPSALMEAAASGEGSAIRGYLHRCKRGKRHWKKLWFVIKGKVLYTYTASEDKVALESLPLLGFIVLSEKGEGRMDPGTVFQLYHKDTLFYSFKAEDHSSAERWIEAMKEATVL